MHDSFYKFRKAKMKPKMCPKDRPKVYCPPNPCQNPLPNPSILAVIFDPPANFVENVGFEKTVILSNWYIVANAVHCLHSRHLHAESHVWNYPCEHVLTLILRSCNFCVRVIFATCLLQCRVKFKKILWIKLPYEQMGCRTNFLHHLQHLDAQLIKCP